MAKYGGFQGTSKRLIELKTLPQIEGHNRSLDRRLRDLGFAPVEGAGFGPVNRNIGNPKVSAGRDGYYYTPCTMPVPIQNVTRSEGRVLQESAMGCSTAHIPISLLGSYLSVIARPARADPAEKGRTGATPLFLPLYRHAGRGGCYSRCSTACPLPFGGRSRPIYPCGKTPNTDHKRALTRRRQAP